MPAVPSVRGEQVVRALERAGFKVARVTGSHHIMRSDGLLLHENLLLSLIQPHGGMRQYWRDFDSLER